MTTNSEDTAPATSPACPEKPELLTGQPIGQYHCPSCGEMLIAGLPHPEYDADTDAAFDDFLRTDPDAQSAMKARWAERMEKAASPTTAVDAISREAAVRAIAEHVGKYDDHYMHYLTECVPKLIEAAAKEIVGPFTWKGSEECPWCLAHPHRDPCTFACGDARGHKERHSRRTKQVAAIIKSHLQPAAIRDTDANKN